MLKKKELEARVLRPGLQDVVVGFKRIRLAIFLAWSDIRQRYRRSTLGPFWITISTAVMISSLGLIFGNIFKAPREIFLPFLAVGLISWSFISSVITGATTVYVEAESIVKQLPLPLFTHILRMLFRNIFIFLHNLIIIPFVFLFVGKSFSWELFLFLPGFLILCINLTWLSLLLSIICTRFRDITQIVSSLLQIGFYVTPIIWLPSMIPSRAGVYVLDPNPFYHLIEIVRGPCLGALPSMLNWDYSLILAVTGWFFTIKIYNIFKNRIAYWL